MNILMRIVLLNNEIMVSADLSTAKCFRCDLPNKKSSKCVWNVFPMFPLLNKGFRNVFNVFDVTNGF